MGYGYFTCMCNVILGFDLGSRSVLEVITLLHAIPGT